jgi:hypothetical protein
MRETAELARPPQRDVRQHPGPQRPELLLVGGAPVVEHGELRTADVAAATRDVRAARRQLQAGQNGT